MFSCFCDLLERVGRGGVGLECGRTVHTLCTQKCVFCIRLRIVVWMILMLMGNEWIGKNLKCKTNIYISYETR